MERNAIFRIPSTNLRNGCLRDKESNRADVYLSLLTILNTGLEYSLG